MVQGYLYSPFEKHFTWTGEANPIQFTGREQDASGLMYYRKRYYVPAWGRFLSEDPIGLAGGPNRYAYVSNSPMSFTDPQGLKKRAYIFVGDTHVSPPILNPLIALGVRRDVSQLRRRFEAAGYEVQVVYQATRDDILQALPGASAIAFIGHNAFEGAVTPYPAPGIDPNGTEAFLDWTDFAAALRGRHLEQAVVHSCYSDRPELREALVGKTGKFEGSKGLWNPVIGVDFGSYGWWKGKWKNK